MPAPRTRWTPLARSWGPGWPSSGPQFSEGGPGSSSPVPFPPLQEVSGDALVVAPASRPLGGDSQDRGVVAAAQALTLGFATSRSGCGAGPDASYSAEWAAASSSEGWAGVQALSSDELAASQVRDLPAGLVVRHQARRLRSVRVLLHPAPTGCSPGAYYYFI